MWSPKLTKRFTINIITFIISFVICEVILVLSLDSCKTKEIIVTQPVEIEVHDTLIIENTNRLDSIVLQLDSIKKEKDSIKFYLDSIEEELFISNYKLERIREYNRIAAQGNNITFLRGWINRVLND